MRKHGFEIGDRVWVADDSNKHHWTREMEGYLGKEGRVRGFGESPPICVLFGKDEDNWDDYWYWWPENLEKVSLLPDDLFRI